MKTCKRAHHYDNTLHKECPECKKERKQQWNLANPERVAQQRRNYREKHKDEILSKQLANRKLFPERSILQGMKHRCYDKNNESYKYYGAKGITICDRWLESFDNFLADMGKRPSPQHSIDRIDNTKGYSPENCRWATPIEQARNRTGNVLITYNGESKCISEWASIYNLPYCFVAGLHRKGLDFADIILLSPRKIKTYDFDNEQQTVADISLKTGISTGTLYYYIKKGKNLTDMANNVAILQDSVQLNGLVEQYKLPEWVIKSRLRQGITPENMGISTEPKKCKNGLHEYDAVLYEECKECKLERFRKWREQNRKKDNYRRRH